MGIILLCPLCDRQLKDIYPVPNHFLTIGHTFCLEMECLNCGNIIKVMVSALKRRTI